MTSETGETGAEAQIRKLMEDRVKAVRTKDVEALMSNYAPDVLSFDAVNSLRNPGSDAARKRAEEWFAAYQGPIGFEMRDLSIAARDDMAFCHCLNRIKGAMTSGNQVDMWVRSTVCYRKMGGKWMITHEHTSVPIDAERGTALADLKP